MKILILLFLMPSFLFAFEPPKKHSVHHFQIYQTDKNADISSLKARKRYLKDLPKKESKISIKKRDAIIMKYLSNFSDMDELDKDLFYLRALHYKEKDFLDRYKNISSKDYSKLKREVGSVE